MVSSNVGIKSLLVVGLKMEVRIGEVECRAVY